MALVPRLCRIAEDKYSTILCYHPSTTHDLATAHTLRPVQLQPKIEAAIQSRFSAFTSIAMRAKALAKQDN